MNNLSFDVRFAGNWVSLFFHVWYFWSNIPSYWFEKFIWLDIIFYFFSYYYFLILLFNIKYFKNKK
jgi:hypothetical protein